MVTPASGADTWLQINGQPLSFHPGEDNLAAGALEFEDNELQVTVYAPRGIEIWIEGERLRSAYAGYWLWRPKAFAGLYEITIQIPGQEAHTATVRVLPGQLSLERYEQMLDDISAISEDLLYQLHAPAFERAQGTQPARPLISFTRIPVDQSHSTRPGRSDVPSTPQPLAYTRRSYGSSVVAPGAPFFGRGSARARPDDRTGRC